MLSRSIASVFIGLLFTSSTMSLELDLNLNSNPDIDKTAKLVELKVIDTYLELHSGPGRGYPIFHVIEQGQTVKVHTRRTNWFYVSDRRNRQGWVKQEGLARTLAPTGLPAALPNTQHGDFLAQQGRIGFSLGLQEKAETVSVTAGFRLLKWAGAEIEYGQLFEKEYDGISYGGSFIIEPLQLLDITGDWPLTPFISKGIGKQEWFTKTKATIGQNKPFKNDYEFTGIGFNYYIGYSFVVRGEYRKMILNGQNDNLSVGAWRVSFNSFF
jgi:hypothetical protein